MDVGEGEGKRLGLPGMRGTRLTGTLGRQALSDRLALKPYWGKPTVRNFRGGRWRRRHHRSPVRAIALPDMWRVQHVALLEAHARILPPPNSSIRS